MKVKGIKFCPECKSEDYNVLTADYGSRYKCKNCGFESSEFPIKQKITKKE